MAAHIWSGMKAPEPCFVYGCPCGRYAPIRDVPAVRAGLRPVCECGHEWRYHVPVGEE
jgi:hypothetical protein